MQLEFTAEQQQLRAAVRSLLDRECPPSVLRERVEKGTPADGLWQQMVRAGWPGLTVPEDAEGLGLGAVEAAVVAEELGRYAAPVPWLSTVTQFTALVRECATAEQRGRWLAPIATGARTGTLAAAEDATTALPDSPVTRATRAGRWWRVSGVKRWVWDASSADEVAVPAGVAEGDGWAVFVLPQEAVQVSPVRAVDASREWATVQLDEAEVPADRVLGVPGRCRPGVRRAVAEAVTAVALEMVGVAQTLLDLTVRQVSTREQFGRPVGSFQAVKHKLADCLVAVERARATGYFAAATLAESDPRWPVAVSTAKLTAGDAVGRLVQDAIQLHGGVGYTWEHDLHLFAKRARADAAVFGTAAAHRRQLARLLGLAGSGSDHAASVTG